MYISILGFHIFQVPRQIRVWLLLLLLLVLFFGLFDTLVHHCMPVERQIFLDDQKLMVGRGILTYYELEIPTELQIHEYLCYFQIFTQPSKITVPDISVL